MIENNMQKEAVNWLPRSTYSIITKTERSSRTRTSSYLIGPQSGANNPIRLRCEDS
jgi:hypothetical protein